MPRGDRTGPMGMGPRTGRAAGYCAGYGMPGFVNPVPGWGHGMGFGRSRGFRGRGYRHWYHATGMPGWMRFGGWGPPWWAGPYYQPDPELEKQALKGQAEALQAELEAVKKRLDELESQAAEQ